MSAETIGSGDWAKRCECGVMCFGESSREAELLAEMHCSLLQQDRDILEAIAVECLKIGINCEHVKGALISQTLLEEAKQASMRIGGNLLAELMELRMKSKAARSKKRSGN